MNNNAGNGDTGLAALLKSGQVRKIICSFPRQVDSWVFDELYRSGKIELELVPQGNLAERLRANASISQVSTDAGAQGRAVQVTGNAGDNILVGNGARNVLAGGGGQDEMTGGGGADSFVFAAGQGGRILDFQDDIDVLRIEGGAARGLTAATLIAGATERDGGVDLHLAGGLVRIEGITVDALRDDLLVA